MARKEDQPKQQPQQQQRQKCIDINKILTQLAVKMIIYVQSAGECGQWPNECHYHQIKYESLIRSANAIVNWLMVKNIT